MDWSEHKISVLRIYYSTSVERTATRPAHVTHFGNCLRVRATITLALWDE
jgi:hypothetical protein